MIYVIHVYHCSTSTNVCTGVGANGTYQSWRSGVASASRSARATSLSGLELARLGAIAPVEV